MSDGLAWKIDRALRRAWREASLRLPASDTRVVQVATAPDLIRALRSIRAASARRPVIVDMVPGDYRISAWVPDGVTLRGGGTDRGSVRLWWDQAGDTLNASGRDVRLSNLTVEHTGPGLGYAVHADGPGRASTLHLDRVALSGSTKAALGLGLSGGQRVVGRDSTFKGRGTADGIYAHNWRDQAEPCWILMDSCTYQAEDGSPTRWIDLGSGQVDVVRYG